MAWTGQLGTASSQPGQVVLGAVGDVSDRAAVALTQWLIEALAARAAAGLEVTQWLAEVLDGRPADLVVTQWLTEYLEGRPASLAITQWLIEVLEPAPLYFEGPPAAVGEDPCVQRSFEAWLELDL